MKKILWITFVALAVSLVSFMAMAHGPHHHEKNCYVNKVKHHQHQIGKDGSCKYCNYRWKQKEHQQPQCKNHK